MYMNRDLGINTIQARRDHRCYGMGLGIIILDDVYPGFPGDVRNASAFPFPIQYEIAEGVDIQGLVRSEDKSRHLEPGRSHALIGESFVIGQVHGLARIVCQVEGQRSLGGVDRLSRDPS